jgi:type IV pilus assembly protein PilA
MSRSPDEGFTLIELLVVIVVLGVLAAIALPSFLGQRQKAYEAAMKSDLHSVVSAQMAYLATHAAPTADPAELEAEGYRQSDGVTPKVQVTAGSFVACVKHTNVADWLAFDSTTGAFTRSATACA